MTLSPSFVVVFLCFLLLGLVMQLVGSQFPDQGLIPCLMQWKQNLHHWIAREVPSQVFLCLFSKVNTLASIGKNVSVGKK